MLGDAGPASVAPESDVAGRMISVTTPPRTSSLGGPAAPSSASSSAPPTDSPEGWADTAVTAQSPTSSSRSPAAGSAGVHVSLIDASGVWVVLLLSSPTVEVTQATLPRDEKAP